MKSILTTVALFLFLGLSVVHALPPDVLESGFTNPPVQTRPWCYYYWISDNISKQGITRDLEAMKRVGIGEALIGNIFLDNQPAGRVKVLSEEWWDLVEHAIREGDRIGVDIGMFNCPGWSQSGGPWIKPEQSMRYVIASETRVAGPKQFSEKLVAPKEAFQDIAVLAFPAPQNDADSLAAHSPRVSSTLAVTDALKLADGDLKTAVTIATGPAKNRKPVTFDIEISSPLTARSLEIFPAGQPFGADGELQVQLDDGSFHSVRKFSCDRSNPSINTGFMPRGPVVISFPAVTSRHFRVVFSNFIGKAQKAELAEIILSSAARVDSFIEKQLAKMHATPLPLWDAYLWPAPVEPDSSKLVVPLVEVKNLTAKLSSDGTLTWDVPAGDWIIQRMGMTPTGMSNSPASPEGQGLEVDKMNGELARKHFDAFIGQLLQRMPASDRKAFKHVVADSYEMGSQNWTDRFEKIFRQQYGYDPLPWLPVLSGRVVGSADQSERFLWDLRRLIADHVAMDYVGGLRASANAHGLGLWLENYGHWGFPGEFLKYGSQSDRIGGEFWVTGDLGSIECRAASSCANTYGKPFVSAESFTGGPPFQNSPKDLKARGDWSFCEGINHVVLHVCIQQPDDAKFPGINAPWGTEFNRHNTWFEEGGKTWIEYERRCCWMLQQGWRVADVAYFIGEDAPKMTGIRNPELPTGRDFDYINADVIEKNLSVKDGLLTLPHGVSYRVLVLPKLSTMRPELLRKIRELVKAGATVVGDPPARSPSMENFPKCDQQVRELAVEIWGAEKLPASGARMLGKGCVIWGKTLADIFAANQTPPDFECRDAAADAKILFTHRHSADADIYFVSNQKDRAERVNCAFRVAGRQPELWNAVTGERRALPQWREANGQTLVPLEFAPAQSWFVVFRQPGQPVASESQNFPAAKPLVSLTHPWQVTFDPKWGGPEFAEFAQLSDWTTRPEEGIQFYSGTATYRTMFDLPAAALTAQGGKLLLDLGKVCDVATVRLNGQNLGTLWTPPWTVDIATAARVGSNALEIAVVNPWNNRLVGDSKLPVNRRLTSLSLPTVKTNAPLRAAGLLGPVTVQVSESGK